MPATPGHLRTEYQIDPLGLDETEPRLSWRLQDDRRGARQTAYQVLVASSLEQLNADQGDLWDSGRVESDATAHIVYSGVALRAFSRAAWKVRVWDGEGATSRWSEAARFELGPLTSDDWRLDRGERGDGWSGATFISAAVVGDPKTSAPAPYLRRSFELEREVLSARLYITALGLYEASINGRRVTDDVYRPGWTDYHRRVPYQAYDVTDLLRQGANALGVILGDGWYCGFIVTDRQQWGERPHLLAQLVIEVAGVENPVIVCSDEMWRTTTGPVLASDNYNGETYDARLELPGWDEPGYDDGAWAAVVETGNVLMHRTCNLVATTAPLERLLPAGFCRWSRSARAGRAGGEPWLVVAYRPGVAPAASVAAVGPGRNDHWTTGSKPVVMDATGLAPGAGALELDGALAASIGRVLATRMEVAPPRPRSGHGHAAGDGWQDGGAGAGVVWVRCEQGRGVGMQRLAEDRFDVTEFDDLPRVHHDRPLTEVSNDPPVVRDQQHSHRIVALQIA